MKIPQATEFEQIKEQVSKKIISDYGKARFANEKPAATIHSAQKRVSETTEAMALLDAGRQVPFMGLQHVLHHTEKIEKGFVLEPQELIEYGDFLRSFRIIRQLFEKNQSIAPRLHHYAQGLADFSEIAEMIFQKIRNGQVDSNASRELRKIRGTIEKYEADLKKVFAKFFKESRYLQENRVIKKNDRYTLPVRAEFQQQIKGTIIERSNKRATVFIEPEAAARLNDRLILAQAEETAAQYQVLSELTGAIAEQMNAVFACLDILVVLDIIFARGKYCREINGQPIAITEEEVLLLDQVRHPLLGTDAVPLSLKLGEENRCMVITGPNAGGKTVVLKTVGLVCAMAHYGLFPAHNGNSSVPFLKSLWMDIGDQQSLENSLSTFSGHMSNIAQIMTNASRNSIVLLDEIGSGTEPNEGAALAIAIMESIYRSGALMIATTHYGEIKQFALDHQDFETAAMAFDAKTLTPKYRLLTNAVGESNAFWISEKMAIPAEVVQTAKDYLKNKSYSFEKQPFETSRKRTDPQETKSEHIFQKGDQVFSAEHEKRGVFYEYLEQGQAKIYIEKQCFVVAARRLQLLTKREALYPAGYDLDQLFSDFAQRKFTRDIERGSKKAQKQLRKAAQERQAKRSLD
ncbi:endonuclease MutS2 [Enterococcus entomosocium]|uniref:endonuclease MutS2 n=1 Tax=Enterococcus entomosocium TaxID=3034352 RepID=UPI003BBE74DC